ncbi:3-isopropylmalate dehydratase small subunit 1-like [Macadamia integrifolia]|uniref:3-isopropylmalate dehydratase small subunit 1-like n=1 Tax=Macadamia integrifolia TaxID=60698 RepID=UPI001C4E69FF|nr:3-isopropylmalate dehydratase small subunit 1-like [Macadamia integrifolia]
MGAAAEVTVFASTRTFISSQNQSRSPCIPSRMIINLRQNPATPITCSMKSPFEHLSTYSSTKSSITPLSATSVSSPTTTSNFHGLCYVLGDSIDTDQIIPAEYLTLVPSNPDEYRKIGSYALIGLPSSYPVRFVEPGEFQSKYSIIIAGANFGCGSSREHAPVALGAAGVKTVVAESYARIFFRNSVATGEVYPLESEVRLCEECSTGDVVTVELAESRLINHTTGKEYKLKPIGDAGPVIEAGGIFDYARKTGMIPSLSPST